MTTTSTPVAKTARPARRRLDRGRKQLLGASMLVLLGSPMPWVSTPVGQVSGFLGGGLWTFYAAMLGFAGVLVPFAKASIAQAAILCLAALGLAGWQVAHVWTLVGFGGWSPGVGLVFVIGGGVLAGAAVRRMLAQLRGVEG